MNSYSIFSYFIFVFFFAFILFFALRSHFYHSFFSSFVFISIVLLKNKKIIFVFLQKTSLFYIVFFSFRLLFFLFFIFVSALKCGHNSTCSLHIFPFHISICFFFHSHILFICSSVRFSFNEMNRNEEIGSSTGNERSEIEKK